MTDWPSETIAECDLFPLYFFHKVSSTVSKALIGFRLTSVDLYHELKTWPLEHYIVPIVPVPFNYSEKRSIKTKQLTTSDHQK